jgi:hypothetical protein
MKLRFLKLKSSGARIQVLEAGKGKDLLFLQQKGATQPIHDRRPRKYASLPRCCPATASPARTPYATLDASPLGSTC